MMCGVIWSEGEGFRRGVEGRRGLRESGGFEGGVSGRGFRGGKVSGVVSGRGDSGGFKGVQRFSGSEVLLPILKASLVVPHA